MQVLITKMSAASSAPQRSVADAVPPAAAPTATTEELTLEEIERRAIENALRNSPGNLARACRKLGISRATIYRKIKKYDLRWETED